MAPANWLALADYSNKYQVSISTLRRRIRSGRAEVKFVDGKYYLKDTPLMDHQMDEFIDSSSKDGQVPHKKWPPTALRIRVKIPTRILREWLFILIKKHP